LNGQDGSSVQFSGIFHANAGFVEEMYDRFLRQPDAVSSEWRAYFDGFKEGFSVGVAAGQFRAGPAVDPSFGAAEPVSTGAFLPPQSLAAPALSQRSVETAAYQLTRAYQEYGHLKARINPLEDEDPITPEVMLPERYGLVGPALDQHTAIGVHFGWEPMKVRDYIDRLDALFCGPVAIEIEHVCTDAERNWLDSRISRILRAPETETRRQIFRELARADALEKTIATKYIGQKRFSVEGADAQIVALETLLDHGSFLGVTEFCMAMAHRGRLNVLVNVARKPLRNLIAEFEGNADPSDFGDGDVKYHCGWETQRETRFGRNVTVSMSFNPSHLEFVDSVVMGEVRAIQEQRHGGDKRSAVPIILHGDAAFAGQGVVYESMQMVGLKGHGVGGTIHIVANNQIGFTTNPSDSRSTRYCSDIGKTFGAPIFHVNGDALDELHQVMCLAAEYRQEFGRDVVIDIVCFRRHGHNESDEPAFTQPKMYKLLKGKKAPFEDYFAKLLRSEPQQFSEADLASVYQGFRDAMDAEYVEAKEKKDKSLIFPESRRDAELIYGGEREILTAAWDTRVSRDRLVELGGQILALPQGFQPNKKIEKIILDERRQMLDGTKPIDWGLGELLAYGSLLSEGHSVRICGQDAGRGTFSHRHAVLVDAETEQRFLGLRQTASEGARVDVIDSFLSETAALGFEYGFASRHHKALTVWEAQFGDFCNGAQVIIDQFVVSGESKWGQSSGLVMLLPHGYEGQGPEHSSARLERFLQLAAQGNMVICSFTRVSQLFHALRRQVKWNMRKPLVVMSPKSFLRNPRAAVPFELLTDETFHELLDDERQLVPERVERVVFCTGKIALDSFAHAESLKDEQVNTTAILRVEQLYPFAADKAKALLGRYPKVKKVFWAQEEPQNMGAWHHMRDEIDAVMKASKLKGNSLYIGRSRRASPAVGVSKLHGKESAALLDAVFLAADQTTV
jgi:2-oxoglutarate dehydrogenase E1 component